MVYLRDRSEIEAIRAAAQLVARTLAMLGTEIRPGQTTGELDRLAEAFIQDHGGRPAFKGYRGFPASICPSINDEVVHAIRYLCDPRASFTSGAILQVNGGALMTG